ALSTIFPYTTLFRSVPEEFLIAALERAVPGERAQMPFADERGGVARVAQERGHGRVFRRQAQRRRSAGNRLVEAATDAVLIASRSEEHTSELQSREN